MLIKAKNDEKLYKKKYLSFYMFIEPNPLPDFKPFDVTLPDLEDLQKESTIVKISDFSIIQPILFRLLWCVILFLCFLQVCDVFDVYNFYTVESPKNCQTDQLWLQYDYSCIPGQCH